MYVSFIVINNIEYNELNNWTDYHCSIFAIVALKFIHVLSFLVCVQAAAAAAACGLHRSAGLSIVLSILFLM